MDEPSWYRYLVDNQHKAKEIMQELRLKKCECGNDIVFDFLPSGLHCTKCLGVSNGNYSYLEFTETQFGKQIFYRISKSDWELIIRDDAFLGILAGNQLRIWKTLRDVKLIQQSEQCADCGIDLSNKKSELHHITSRRDGGSDDLENLKILCLDCHYKYAINGFY